MEQGCRWGTVSGGKNRKQFPYAKGVSRPAGALPPRGFYQQRGFPPVPIYDAGEFCVFYSQEERKEAFMIKLSPSILSADFANLQRDIAIAVDAGAEYVHVDCMDGHFVPNLTIGAPVVKALRKATDATLDVHLMIANPDQYLDDFIKAGSDIITVHYESNGDTLEQVRKIKAAGIRACVSIKPGTPADVLMPLLPELDMVLIMTVEPGFGGQGYIDACTDKIRQIRKAIDENGYKCELEIDGGAKLTNTPDIVAAGANVIVAGSAVFGGDIAGNVKGFKKIFDEFENNYFAF